MAKKKTKVEESPKVETPKEDSKHVILFDVNEKAIKILKEDEERFLKMGYRKELPKK